jgi:small subunit ribosomal protein S8
MLTRLRNANQAYHDSTSMPHSKIKAGIAEILKAQGYIAGFEVLQPEPGEVGKTLRVRLKYGDDRARALAGLRRISKPGLRVYAKSTAMPKVLGGLGIAIISTSQGLLTDKEAKAKNVGGEVLAYIW